MSAVPDRLDPQARALLKTVAERGLPATEAMSVADARRAYRERRGFTQPEPPSLADVENRAIPGPGGELPIRIYRASLEPKSPSGALVYFHGGGWVIGDLDTHDTLCRQLALRSKQVVIAVDYRLAPENPYPAAVDDAIAATEWVIANADALGLDPRRIAVGGDSAGGNLAAVVTHHFRDTGGARLAFQLLIYPATDQRTLPVDPPTAGVRLLLTAATMQYFHDHYIADPDADQHWQASPVAAKRFDGLPPALILTAGFDPLREEGTRYAQALSEAGNACTLVCFERQIHGFILMGKVLNEADHAVSLCAMALGNALGAPTGDALTPA